ncbi:metallophosphoesterase [Rhizobium sp. WYCCWR 11146]|uniref:metallophosphoesterase n=1 Tax=Rhizobium sp. WYCCWR 11146 TaxID=2749833 RepID=UPI0032B19815
MADTLKAAVFSDLHLRYNQVLDFKFELPDDVDVLIVAGDISSPVSESLYWLNENVSALGREIVFVAGNHEHYGEVYEESMAEGIAERAKYPHIHFLENEAVVIKGVRFLGATMWTDFELFGDPSAAMTQAFEMMNDYQAIQTAKDGKYYRFRPTQTKSYHDESRAWLRTALSTSHDGPTVVVTHTAPHRLSIAGEYARDGLTPSFVSDLSAEIEEFQPELWVHGHTHSSFDYVVPGTRTRVVCNPLGYVEGGYMGNRRYENTEFDRSMIVEITRKP